MSLRITPCRVVLASCLAFLGFIAYRLVDVFRPKEVSKMEPQAVFRWLVCDPMPSTVTAVKVRGSIMSTAGRLRSWLRNTPKRLKKLIHVASARGQPLN